MKRLVRVSGCLVSIVLSSMLWSRPAQAVIVLGGRDVTGTLDNSGQNLNPAPSNLGSYVGLWGSFVGTPIAPQYFVTANHIGDGGSGGTFIYNDGGSSPVTYTATFAGNKDDLAIWKLTSGQFTHYAPIYTGSNEIGMSMIDIGRGTTRGTVVDTPGTSTPAGWNWGPNTGAVSWGANTVASVATFTPPIPNLGGDFLQWTFNNNGNPDTGILSNLDSGGPTFVFNPADNQYELAGINSLVDQYSTQSDPNGQYVLAAALYNGQGFWNGTTPNPGPASSYSTRISSRLAFVDSVTGLPEPTLGAFTAIGGILASNRRRRSSI